MIEKRFCIKGKYLLLVALLSFFFAKEGAGQIVADLPEEDSVQVFPLAALYDRVLEFHPLVKQAGLLTEEASRQVMEARGVFDPKLQSRYDRKMFKDRHYFTTWQTELKIPVLINTDLKVGYEKNEGYYLNEQQVVPDQGLIYAGINLALGQGLITDDRRLGLRTTALNQTIAEAERIKMLNKVLFEAAKDYWNWSVAWYQLQINQEGVELARIRFQGIKEGVFAGDAAAIDSVEAKITLQSREVDLVQSQLDYQNALLQLAMFLWDEDGQPLRPSERIVPEPLWQLSDEPLQTMEILADLAQRQHPDIRKLEGKMQQLEVEERLYRELLKPLVNVQYSYLNVPANMVSEINYSFTENYKLGVDFSFPLLLRKERAKLQINRIKQQRTQLDLVVSQRQINYGLQQAYNDFLTLRRILQEQQEIVRNYERMLEGELEKFEAGESSLFLVNTRENNLLEARVKLISLAAKYQKSRAAVMWSAGVTGPDVDFLQNQGISR